MTHNDIHNICKDYNIRNYTINDDNSIDVNGGVDLLYCNLSELPLNFNKVTGYFNCHGNNLTTLKGAPKIVNSNFMCGENKLTTFKYAPLIVKGNLYCHYNRITMLENIPSINGIPYFDNNPIEYIYNIYVKSVDNIELFNDFKIIEDVNIINLNRLLSYSNINGYGEPNIERILLLGYVIK